MISKTLEAFSNKPLACKVQVTGCLERKPYLLLSLPAGLVGFEPEPCLICLGEEDVSKFCTSIATLPPICDATSGLREMASLKFSFCRNSEGLSPSILCPVIG